MDGFYRGDPVRWSPDEQSGFAGWLVGIATDGTALIKLLKKDGTLTNIRETVVSQIQKRKLTDGQREIEGDRATQKVAQSGVSGRGRAGRRRKG